jgi:hypothetical protein
MLLNGWAKRSAHVNIPNSVDNIGKTALAVRKVHVRNVPNNNYLSMLPTCGV